LRMHRAGVLAPGRGERRRLGIERHSTLRTRSRADLPDFRAHRTNISRANVGPRVACGVARRLRTRSGGLAHCWHDQGRSTQRHKSRPHRLGRGYKNHLGIRLELCEAASRAEEILFSVVLRLVASVCRIYIHAANGVFLLGGGRCAVRGVHRVEVVHSFVARNP
jgi:hypothetical protein